MVLFYGILGLIIHRKGPGHFLPVSQLVLALANPSRNLRPPQASTLLHLTATFGMGRVNFSLSPFSAFS